MSVRERLMPPGGVPLLLASAVLLGLAHPPFHLLVPSFVALVPFGVWVGRLPRGVEGRRAALRGGFLLGLVYFTLVFYWLAVALVFYTALALLAFVLPVLILSGFLAVATVGMHATRTRLGWPVWLALPVFWTGMEWLRAHLGPVSFPWMGLGDTLTGYPWLVGAADLVGSRGIGLWLALCNGVLASLALRVTARARQGSSAWPRPPDVLRGAAIAAALLLPVAYSLQRWRSLSPGTAARVAVVQPNVPEDIKLQRQAAVDSAARAIATLTAVPPPEIDLLLLPETVFPSYVEPLPSRGYDGDLRVAALVEDLARRLDAAVLYGALGTDDRGGGEYDYFNSAFLVTPDGRPGGRYDKRWLVPVVERVPFVDPRWFRGLEYFGGFGVGAPARPLRLDSGVRFGVLICYESIFAEASRAQRLRGADFLVNITNDAWFGREEPWWSRSSALYQHPAHLVMRAIENRIGIARSANTGISGVVDPLGRWRERTPLFEPAAFAATVTTTDGLTPYARYGDVAGLAAALTAMAAAVAAGLRAGGGRRRGREAA